MLRVAAQEISILKGLNYDCNITQFYGACIQPGGRPMLISEFMEGVYHGSGLIQCLLLAPRAVRLVCQTVALHWRKVLQKRCKCAYPGGNLAAAIEHDDTGELRWYGRGHRIALDIARGLFYLHSHDVRCLMFVLCAAAAGFVLHV